VATPISWAAQKYFLRGVKVKLCSKFGEDRSKAAWAHNLIHSRRMDGHRMDGIYILSKAVDCIGQTKIWHGRVHVTTKIFRVPLISQDRVKLRM